MSTADAMITAHSATSAGAPANAANVPCRLSMHRIETNERGGLTPASGQRASTNALLT
jgi:hypothetical protein